MTGGGWLVGVWLLLAPEVAAAADGRVAWLAVNDGPRAALLRREVGGDERWTLTRRLPGRTLSIAGGEAGVVVLTIDGRLHIADGDRVVTLPDPPTRPQTRARVGGNVLRARLHLADERTLAFTDRWREADDAAPAEPANAAVIGGVARRYDLTDDGQLRERLEGGDERITPVPGAEAAQFAVPWWLLAAVAGLLVLSWGRPPAFDLVQVPAGLRVAPLARRLIAGVVDLVVSVAPVWLLLAGIGDATQQLLGVAVLGMFAYVLSSTLVEAASGRSVGKWLTGLRVARPDGTPATWRQRVTRGLLRAVDVWPVAPLVIVLHHPLRQRLGDMTAGTVVVSGYSATA